MDLVILAAGLVLEVLEELVDRHHPQRALRLVAVGLGGVLALRSQRHVLDNHLPFAALVDKTEMIKVGNLGHDFTVVVEPGHLRLFYVNLEGKRL